MITSIRHQLDITTPLAITIRSALPTARGMGSSAATAVALTRALYDWAERPLSTDTLIRTVDISEDIIHGHPSGIDALTTASAEPVWFVSHQAPQQLHLDLPAYLVIADSGVQGQTGPAVAHVKALLDAYGSAGTVPITTLGRLTYHARRAIATRDITLLGRLLNDAHRQLTALGVSTPKLDMLVNTARQAGAVGAKLTGGGLGGCMIALCAQASTAQRVSTALRDAGAVAIWSDPLGGQTE